MRRDIRKRKGSEQNFYILNLSADVYAFGVFMWELASRTMYFSEIPWVSDLADKVVTGDRPEIPPWVPTAYASLIASSWVGTIFLGGKERKRKGRGREEGRAEGG
jgi:hypothetical protein